MVEDMQMVTVLTDCYRILKQAREEGSIHQLPGDQFKNVISCCQKLTATPNTLLPPILTDLAAIFLQTLADCHLTFDNQILASTAFSLILNLIQEPLNISLLFSKNFIPAGNEPFQVKLSKTSELLTVAVRRSDVFKLCAISGLLQLGDSFWTSQHLNWNALMIAKIFPLLESHCFQYTQLTTLAFKTLKIWLVKINASVKPSRKLLPEILLRVVKIIMSNWENPINGIREQNSLLFEQFLVSCDSLQPSANSKECRYLSSSSLIDLILMEQSWMMKSKYFMLSVLVPKNGTYKVLTSMGTDLVTGLMTSLNYTHLVSAGTELYKICLEDLSLESWQQIFLPPILKLLLSSSHFLPRQNLFNYWIPPTIKKFKSVLNVLLDAVMESESGTRKEVLLPIICCLKIGRKEGYENMQWHNICDMKFLSIGLKHSDEAIRSHSFAVVCVSSKTSLPSDEEFICVKNFLEENINVDQQSLRHSMVSSLASFLCRVRDSSLNLLQSRIPDSAALAKCVNFLDWLFNFLKENLEVGTNYQRRFTSLEIYKIVLSYFTEDSVPTIVQRKGSLKNDRQNVMKYAMKLGKWGFTDESSREMLLYCISDPANDVREAAATLLMTYFKISDHETTRFCELYKKALALCSDSLFYCVESGALLVQVVATLGYKYGGGQGGLKSLGIATKDERVLSTLLILAQNQAADLKEDLLKAASQGAPLHGVLRAIERLVIDKNSPERNKLSEAERLKLITLLETTAQHLLQVLASKTSNINEFAPSFCEMGEAIEDVLKESSVNIDEGDKNHLSPAYQLVLNCIWLNLRVCCSVASGLVASYGASVLGAEEAWRCAEIPLSVLRMCRHKGALESAGASLAVCVRSLSTSGLITQLHRTLLDAMNNLLERPITTSTRGAGFVVMVHRAVAADATPTKPLLEMCVEKLIEIVEMNRGDVCLSLQLLAALVQDSSLTQEMARHLHKLALISISTMASSSYPIRNGGLHLFGAVVPKLVGQRKRLDGDESSFGGHHMAYEELHYHSPGLMKRLIDELKGSDSARIVASLTLISNLTVSPLRLIDRSSVDSCHQDLVEATEKLLSSPMINVRRLAAQANARLHLPTHLVSLVNKRIWPVSLFLTDRSLNSDITSENQLHGFLLNIKYLMERYQEEKIGNTAINQQLKQIDHKTLDQLSMASFEKISFLCRAVLSELSNFNDSKPANRQIEEIIATVNSVSNSPKSIGLYAWTTNEMIKIIKNCPLDKLVPSLYTCLIHCEIHELHKSCLTCLMPRVTQTDFKPYANEIFNILGHYVVTQIERVDCTEVLEIILEILVRHKSNLAGVSASNVIKALTGDVSLYKVKIPSVRVAVLSALQGVVEWDFEVARELSYILQAYCNPAECDEDTRYNAARALALLASPFAHWHDDQSALVKANIWESAVNLLQDEHPRVRSQASKFSSLLNENSNMEVWNPNVSLDFMFTDTALLKFLSTEDAIRFLWSNLKCRPSELAKLEIVNHNAIQNPFETGSCNIYAEQVKIVELSFNSLIKIISNDQNALKILPSQEIIPHLKELKLHCLKLTKFYGDHLLSNSAILNSVWYIISKKISSMYKIINYVNNVGEEKEIEMFGFRYLGFLEQMV